jgi:hypothetical protein
LGWADLELMAGNKPEGRATLERARAILEKLTQEQPRSRDLLGPLIFSLSELGEGDAALRAVEKFAALSAGDARAESSAEEVRARVLARFGDRDRAIASIQSVLSKPSDGSPPLTPALLRLDPDFDSLRGNSRFEKLCQEPAK